MKSTTHLLVGSIVLALGSSCLAGPARADDKRNEQQSIRDAVQRGELLPLPKVLNIASAKVPGDIIEVELEPNKKNILIYEIKILASNGHVRKVKIDARSGDVLEVESD